MKKLLFIVFTIYSVCSFAQTKINTAGSNSIKNINDAITGSITASGTDTYTATVTNLTWNSGETQGITFTNANTGSSTFQLNGGTTYTLKKFSSGSLVNLSSGDISAGEPKIFYNNGTYLVMKGGSGSGGTSGLVIGTTTVTSGTNTRIPYNNAGVLGEYNISGSGSVAMTTNGVFTTPNLGTPSTINLPNGTGLPESGVTNLTSDLAGKQANLVSGTNIRTVNGSTLLGSTNLAVGDLLAANNLSDVTAGTALTNLGGTTVGKNVFGLTNPSAITFLRFNADNSVSALSASSFRTAIGAGTGSGDALVTNPLSQFASTTSAQLAGIMSDETGSGALVFGTSPSFTTPLLGTPTSGNFSTGSFTWPTFNQNTSGSAATLTTPRAIYGNNFDGSAALTQIIASTYGGTGNGFTKFSGPASTEKTFTLPNASATVLTDNAVVTVAQGGSGATTLTGALVGNGTSAFVGSNVSLTELNYVDGVTSAIQTQIDTKAAALATHVIETSNRTMGLTDAGKTFLMRSVSNQTVTLPAFATTAFPEGTRFTYTKDSTSTNLTFTAASGVTIESSCAGSVTAGSITVSYQDGPIVAEKKNASNTWYLWCGSPPLPGITSGAQGDIPYVSGTGPIFSMLTKSATANQVLSNGGSSNNPAWSQITSAYVQATATNDAAAAGFVGETAISTVSTYANFTTTATYQNITSISLTAGDWDVSAFFTYSSNSATITAASNAIFVIGTTTASASGTTEGLNIEYVPQAALLATSKESGSIGPYRVSLSGTTTYYLNAQATFTVGNPQYVGTIRARRIR